MSSLLFFIVVCFELVPVQLYILVIISKVQILAFLFLMLALWLYYELYVMVPTSYFARGILTVLGGGCSFPLKQVPVHFAGPLRHLLALCWHFATLETLETLET